MSYRFARWEPATKCVGGPRPGAQALLAWFLREYQGVARNGGIYNCRSIRGSNAKSVHSEGRAVDIMFPVVNNRAHQYGHDAIQRLGPVADKLGITLFIYDRTTWSARAPRGARYRGVHPHVDHIHAELTREAAESLTAAQIDRLVGPGKDLDKLGSQRLLRVQRPYLRGDDIKVVQRAVGAPMDGIYGPYTATKVATFQLDNGLKPDGVVGAKTWELILAT